MIKECAHCGAKNAEYSRNCQWCGKDLNEPVEIKKSVTETIAPVQAIQNDALKKPVPSEPLAGPTGIYDEKNKNLIKMFRFALKKALDFKLWKAHLATCALSSVIFIVVMFISMGILFPLFAECEQIGGNPDKILSSLEKVIFIQPGEIFPITYFILFFIILTSGLSQGVRIASYGYVYNLFNGKRGAILKTFRYYLANSYAGLTAVILLAMFSGLALPMRVIEHTVNNAAVAVLWLLWLALMGLISEFMPVALMFNKKTIDALLDTLQFVFGNLWNIIKLYGLIILFAFMVILIASGISVGLERTVFRYTIKNAFIYFLLSIPVLVTVFFMALVSIILNTAFFISFNKKKGIRVSDIIKQLG